MSVTTACPRFEANENPCDGVWRWRTEGGAIVGLESRTCTHPLSPVMECLSRADAWAILQIEHQTAA